jgi:hypothetical protein
MFAKRNSPPVDAFGFASLSAGGAALVAIVASGLYRSWFAPIAFVMHFVAFEIVFFVVWLLFRRIRPYTGALGPWLFIPTLAGALGFVLPFAIGLLAGLFPIYGGIGGVVGGLAGAWAWRHAERNPGSLRSTTSLQERLSPAALVVAALGIGMVLVSLAAVIGIW